MLCHPVPDREETQEGKQMKILVWVMVILIVLAFIFIAVTLYCCLVVSSRADERIEKWEKENERETD